MATATISPFNFLALKEDENALMAGDGDAMRGYYGLLTVDGIDMDEVMAHAEEVKGEEWPRTLAVNFPAYMAAVAAKAGSSCFVTTGKAHVEYVDLNTNEVLEMDVPASAEKYNEAVRVEEARLAHGENAEDDDSYEDVDDEEDEDEEDDEVSEKAMLYAVLSNQLEGAMTFATTAGITPQEIYDVFQKAIGADVHVPKTPKECAELAQHDEVLMSALMGHGAPEGAAPGCQQQ